MIIQLAFAVICCNLPTYKPLLPRRITLESWFSSIKSRLSRGKVRQFTDQKLGNSLSNTIGSKDGRRNKFKNIHTEELNDLVVSTKVVGGRDDSGVERDYPVNAIKMTNTFDVV